MCYSQKYIKKIILGISATTYFFFLKIPDTLFVIQWNIKTFSLKKGIKKILEISLNLRELQKNITKLDNY